MNRTIEKTDSKKVGRKHRIDLWSQPVTKPQAAADDSKPESSSGVPPQANPNEQQKLVKSIIISMGVSIVTFCYFIRSGQLEFVSAFSFIVGSSIGHGIGLLTLYQSFRLSQHGHAIDR